MISIFYRQGAEIIVSQHETEFAKLSKSNVLWIDLLSPNGDEKRATEAFLGTEIQSRATAEEIESSSRFFENETAIFANTNFLSPAGDEMTEDPVSFTIAGNTLATLRDIPLRSFDQLQRRIQARPSQFENGWYIFASILDQRVDLDADIIELMSKETSQFSRRINQKEDINEDFLLDINQLQENAMMVRENIVDKQRLITNILKSDRYPDKLEVRLNVIQQDISSLINHTNFNFERLEYLQDTAVGLINLEQNNIMKVFTLISVLLMPATLIASFYGMNVELPFASFKLAWVGILAVMVVILLAVIFVFRHKKFF
ncbi:MAG: magnesium and cobalt transport protein CorA [Bacteroidales bacterium]|nr:magnesium and cobalt transport protein CorA [Bacteroidales bacterium]